MCGVASVQPVVNVLAPIPQPSPAHLPPPPVLPLHPSLSVPAIGDTNSLQQQTSQHHQQQHQPHPPGPEQNGILDWLRKLRLHKYYPVFKQLTMEEVQRDKMQPRGVFHRHYGSVTDSRTFVEPLRFFHEC